MPRLKPPPADIDKYIKLVAETPRRIAAAAEPVEESRLTTSPGPKEWSALDILAHLRSCDDTWTYSIYAMLSEKQPDVLWPDERRWAKTAGYNCMDFRLLLQTFSLKRAELVGVLEKLPAEAWERSGTIEGRHHTVFSQVRRMALHENAHCEQLETLLSIRSKKD